MSLEVKLQSNEIQTPEEEEKKLTTQTQTIINIIIVAAIAFKFAVIAYQSVLMLSSETLESATNSFQMLLHLCLFHQHCYVPLDKNKYCALSTEH